MRIQTALSLTAAWLALPALVLAAYLFQSTQLPATPGYGIAAATAGAAGIVLVGVRAGAAPVPAVAGVWAATTVFAAGIGALGFGIGARTPLVIAGPVVIVGSYAAMVIPLLLEPSWLRQLTGMWTSCCHIDQTLSPRAMVATALVGIGLMTIAAVLVSSMPTRGALVATGVVVAAVAVATAAVVDRASASGAVARSGDLVCAQRVCLWPEHRDQLARTATLADAVAAAAAAWQLQVPEQFSERPPPDGLGFVIASPRLDAPALTWSLADSLFPLTEACAAAIEEHPDVTGFLADRAIAVGVLAEAAGVDAATVHQQTDSATMRGVRRIQSLPQPEQARWLRAVQSAAIRCDPTVPR